MPLTPADLFPNLRELYITIIPPTKPADLLTMLRGLPLLEHVYLSADIMHPLEAPHDDFARLPCMRTIALSVNRNTTCLLHRLVLPPDCFIRLEGLVLQEVTPCPQTLERQLDAGQLTRLLLSKEQDFCPSSLKLYTLYVTLCNVAANMGLQLGIVRVDGRAYER